MNLEHLRRANKQHCIVLFLKIHILAMVMTFYIPLYVCIV